MIKIAQATMPYRCNLILKSYGNWLVKNDTVLDVGCGNGLIAKFLQDNLKIKITGCDIKNYLMFDLPFVKTQGDKLPFTNNAFDAVLLNDVLHHIRKNKQEKILKEALRVGKKVLIFEAEPTSYGKLADIILNKLHYGKLDTPLSFKSMQEWQKIFKESSIKFEVIKLSRPFWYPFSHIAFCLKANNK